VHNVAKSKNRANDGTRKELITPGDVTLERNQYFALVNAAAATDEQNRPRVIAADFALSETARYKKMSAKSKLEHENRDLIRALLDYEQRFGGHLTLISLADKKSKKQPMDALLMNKLIEDYNQANKFATAAAQNPPVKVRNLAKEPHPFMDQYYLVHKGDRVLQGSVHEQFRKLQKEKHIQSWYKRTGDLKKNATKTQKTFALARQHADLKLSNVTSKRRNAHTHQVAALLCQFRTHSFNTMLKYCVKPLCMDDDDPKKEYYRKMYNRFCIYCKNVDEHTDHILTCQNRRSKKDCR
jgi:hypothetical protein